MVDGTTSATVLAQAIIKEGLKIKLYEKVSKNKNTST
jgi:chaperonin GroEL (HSP60 family)